MTLSIMKTRLDSAGLRGIFPAIPTPVGDDDRVDEVAARAQMALILRGGANGVVPLGGTGEYGALPRAERVREAGPAQTAGRRV